MSTSVALVGKLRRPGANEPKPSRLAFGAVLKLFSCGTLASRSAVVGAPIALMSSLEMLTRFEPVGGTPRMLDPVTTISSNSSVEGDDLPARAGAVSWVGLDGACCAEATE